MKSQPVSLWDMFTRETLQNSWDARDTDSIEDGVTFAIEYQTLSDEQANVLRHNVLGNDFLGLDALHSLFKQDQIVALYVSDRGTNGLRGPTSAGVSTNGPTDFTSFVRNIGRSDTKELAGGTYGFGKGVFFIASTVSTAVVYTRTVDEHGNRVNRLISMANTDDFSIDGQEYTGRHWWGVREFGGTENNRQEFAEPFTGEAADSLAAVLGLDRYYSDERPTGTTIMVLQPNMDSEGDGNFDPQRTMEKIAGSLTRWAWPHMVDAETHMDPIDFHVSCNGTEVEIPNPAQDPALELFITAYKQALSNQGTGRNRWDRDYFHNWADVWTSRPAKKLGHVVVRNMPKAVEETETVIGHEVSGHIALIRNPRMVVQYYQGPVSNTNHPYCGVFIADPSADKIFARSEPAAHHEWNHQTIQQDTELLREFWDSPTKSNPVRIFFTKLADLLKDQADENALGGDGRHFQAVTELSNRFGHLVSNAASGASPNISLSKDTASSPNRRTTNPKSPTSSVALHTLQAGESGVSAIFDASIHLPRNASSVEVEFLPTVASDGGSLKEKDLEEVGLDVPTVLSWSFLDDEAEESSSSYEYDGPVIIEESCKLRVRVHQPPNCAISLKAKLTDTAQEEE